MWERPFELRENESQVPKMREIGIDHPLLDRQKFYRDRSTRSVIQIS